MIETPPQSPDLNIIENVWDHLEIRIRQRPITSTATLKSALQLEWVQISPDYLANLVSSMPRRLQAVIDAKGGPTKY